MSSRTVLVTGGAGYVGAHTCKRLRASGYVPVTFDNLTTGHEHFARWGPLVKGDIRDTDAVRQALCSYEIEAVLHFAASALVGESVANPQKYYENNVAGSISLLSAMIEAGCRKLVFSSSCAVYGEPVALPIREAAALNPVNPYGASKAIVERILADYTCSFDLQSISLRYFNAAGADSDGELGELRDPETHLIPRAMMAAQSYLADFEVFGCDFDTPDRTAIRDYVHVEDLADAHVAALIRLVRGKTGGAFNLGSGHGCSVKQVLDAIAAETGVALAVSNAPRREGDPAVLVADTSLSRSELGWEPRRSNLTTIVKSAWAWHLKARPRIVDPLSPALEDEHSPNRKRIPESAPLVQRQRA